MPKTYHTWLWRLERPDHPGPSYVFGSMHVRDRRALRWLELAQSAIDACEAFAAEFDLNEVGRSAPLPLLLQTGQPLDQLLSERKYTKLRRILRKTTGLDIHPYRHLPPLLLQNLVTEQLFSADAARPLDQLLWQYAQDHGKSCHGLETFDSQLRLLQSISPEEQARSLLDQGRNINRQHRHLLRLLHYYEHGRIEQLHRSVRHGLGKLRAPLLYRRNAHMADRIDQLSTEQTICCAIGAGHLWGGKGVLRLLKRKGFRVEAVEG